MLLLLADRGNALFPAKRQLVKPGKVLHSIGDLCVPALLGEPVDHIHRIIKKMGIDLCLQGIEFRNSQFFRRF